MNKLFISLIGAATLFATQAAVAGPDFEAIERARKAKQAAQVEGHGESRKTARPTADDGNCPPEAPTLELDHGPRAQTTPQANEQLQERYEAQLKACERQMQ